MLSGLTDEAVQRAIEDIESVKGYLNDVCNHQSVRTYDSLDLAIKLLHQYQKPNGSTSDGYHTFDELYHHRAVLFSALCYAYKDKAWRAKKHHDGSMFGDDWFICGVETPQGQYTYHYHISECWDLFDFCKTLDNAPEWDGHQPKDVDRLLSLRQMRTEPCRCTEICGICNNPNYHIHSSIWWKSASMEYGRENREISTRHCPNCGRNLVKQDG